MPKTRISLIAAMSSNRAIGMNNALPWPEPIPADWANLEKVTAGCKMIMGRKSYDNPHRVWSKAGNYVVTRNPSYTLDVGFKLAHSLQEALDACQDQKEVYVIGGQQIFEQAISIADKMVLTHVKRDFEGDTFFPVFDVENWNIENKKVFLAGEHTPYPMEIITYLRKF